MTNQVIIDTAAMVASRARALASRGIFDGTRYTVGYMASCTQDVPTLCMRVIYTRDVGMHTCGWWRNPDYERCWHLSLSPKAPVIIGPGACFEPEKAVVEALLLEFFGEHVSKTWLEPAYSGHGKQAGVEHWRLFCDKHWKPIVPRGEVYSSELTEAGWRSASEVSWLREKFEASERELADDGEVRP